MYAITAGIILVSTRHDSTRLDEIIVLVVVVVVAGASVGGGGGGAIANAMVGIL